MARDVARATLYRGAINLWVEDEITRAYLSEVWNDPAIAYFIGGGHDGVSAIVHDAKEAGYPNVFGLIDRDFRRTNVAGWNDPNKTFRTFVLPVHELENYLLDSAALSGCRFNNVRRTQVDIEAFMKAEATRRVSWAACRDVVALLRERFRGRFLKDPAMPPIDSQDAALDYICGSEWSRSLLRRASAINEPRIRRLLSHAHARAERRLADETWRFDFAGKEIFHHVGSMIFDRTKVPNYSQGQVVFHADLAKEVADWQVTSGTVPPDLRNLLMALKLRITPNSSGA